MVLKELKFESWSELREEARIIAGLHDIPAYEFIQLYFSLTAEEKAELHSMLSKWGIIDEQA